MNNFKIKAVVPYFLIPTFDLSNKFFIFYILVLSEKSLKFVLSEKSWNNLKNL